jgi:hypothetical protein
MSARFAMALVLITVFVVLPLGGYVYSRLHRRQRAFTGSEDGLAAWQRSMSEADERRKTDNTPPTFIG